MQYIKPEENLNAGRLKINEFMNKRDLSGVINPAAKIKANIDMTNMSITAQSTGEYFVYYIFIEKNETYLIENKLNKQIKLMYSRNHPYSIDGGLSYIHTSGFGPVEFNSRIKIITTKDSGYMILACTDDFADIISIKKYEEIKNVLNKEIENNRNKKLLTKSSNVKLTNTKEGLPEKVSFEGLLETSEVTFCGANILELSKNFKIYNSAGIRYDFDPEEGTIKITQTGERTGDSASSNMLYNLNGQSLYANAIFRFGRDTRITISLNPDRWLGRDSKIRGQILDGSSMTIIGSEGYTMIAKAGITYGFRLVTPKDFNYTQPVILRPQIEIGSTSTPFKPFTGATVKNPTTSSSENIIDFDENISEVQSLSDKNIAVITNFYHQLKAFSLNSSGNNSNTFLKMPGTNTVNGISQNYIFKFKPIATTTIYVYGYKNPFGIKQYIGDGHSRTEIPDKGLYLEVEANKEYGYLVFVPSNTKLEEAMIFPKISIGVNSLRLQEGITTIYTSDSSFVYAQYEPKEEPERIMQYPIRPMLTFIDDDTTSEALVKRYHDALTAVGAIGDYAVMLKNLEDNPNLPNLLREYEDEGFGMLYHCYLQRGEETAYWKYGQTRDLKLSHDNFVKGLRLMKTHNFLNWEYWVTPYGENDHDMQAMAQRYGMKCLISNGNSAFINLGISISRWSIPRMGLSENYGLEGILNAIEAIKQTANWIIVTTHANAWSASDTMEQRIKQVVEHCNLHGIKVVNFAEGFESRKAFFDANDVQNYKWRG